MKIKQILPLFLMLSPIPVLADVGDIHTIKAAVAVVHEGAGEDTPQIDKLNKGKEVMEMNITGEWYEIYDADTDVGGWVHVSTLEILGGGISNEVANEAAAATKGAGTRGSAKSTGSGAPQPKTAKILLKSKGSISASVRKFEEYLTTYNARTNELKGYIPFSAAEDAGNGDLLVTVTNKWLDKPNARKKTSLINIYSKWKRALKTPDVKVYAVDPSGNKITNYPG